MRDMTLTETAPADTELLPSSVAIVDDDGTFSRYLADYLQGQGMSAVWFADSDDLLCSASAFQHDFYVLDLMLPGIDGLDLLRLLRRRTQAGVLVVSGKNGSEVFGDVISAGADMLLAKPASFEQILLGIRAVFRRSGRSGQSEDIWRFDAAGASLHAPDGALIELSPSDVLLLSCLIEHRGDTVGREVLAQRLGLSDEDPNALHAAIYRLRRRIERATSAHVPLQSKSRQGYSFKARLQRV